MTRFKQTVSSILFRTGIIPAFVRLGHHLSMETKNSFQILNYHRVNDFNDPFTIDSVAASDFDAQMRYLSKNYHVLALGDIHQIITKREKLPAKCIAITFDDGYADNYTFAWPILKRYQLPATIFLTAGCINDETPLWFDQVLSAFKSSEKKQFCCPFTQMKSDIQEPLQKLGAAHIILGHLKKAGNAKRKAMIPLILSELGVQEDAPVNNQSALLSWHQINEMSGEGICFGAHTMTHPILADLSESEVTWELAESKKLISKKLNRPTDFFAYPNGRIKDFNLRDIHAVQQAGYKAALTTEPEINTPDSHPFTWGRYRPWQNQVEYFATSLLIHGLKQTNKSQKRI